ncbi:phosphodiester glycosidase family protein [Hymenobacter sp. BT635]|uniref:Phosphodiester glycosidase family protein n=1 Tax=Hymenobacter nitidus TaxID=2880929 RepID=A0ABS8A9L2_9BACT|nr:phosphodiester glycosidase family protein [Hymenobacter nitidus]MCB2377087.1 phosphodiester glycosidase family protein [Hymenobacter nitidus]
MKLIWGVVVASLALLGLWWKTRPAPEPGAFVSYRVDARRQNLRLYWQDDTGQPLRSIQRLKEWLGGQHQRLVFATNAGMFREGNAPLGLFIQEGKLRTPLDTMAGSGNFYLKPNGVFFTTTDGRAAVCTTEGFVFSPRIRYATQSGPMLVLAGQIHPAFRPESTNLNVRNGVGILPDGQVVFAMSKEPVSLYAFAAYFQQLGCRNALYLDGFVSRTYLPEKHWQQTDGDFGVMIGVSEPER